MIIIIEVSEIMLIERLFSSSLLMLVSTQAPRKLRIYHFQKNNEICAQSYTNTVLGVKLNRNVRLNFCYRSFAFCKQDAGAMF